ncbi:hypothetical protein E0L16_15775 [Enterobacter quasihormaechei]|uniref:Uncharacterized protein n=1 Tax=Enterobacter quasihormaechei TaxID=2529382 RepID=A0AAE8UB93_9ENTR|nr:hypothetical protein DP185_12455 [Enterobacter hormaechei]TCB84681.1 hypothetical protein E0L16_15775 [Enterobacter quasihormaechei]
MHNFLLIFCTVSLSHRCIAGKIHTFGWGHDAESRPIFQGKAVALPEVMMKSAHLGACWDAVSQVDCMED